MASEESSPHPHPCQGYTWNLTLNLLWGLCYCELWPVFQPHLWELQESWTPTPSEGEGRQVPGGHLAPALTFQALAQLHGREGGWPHPLASSWQQKSFRPFAKSCTLATVLGIALPDCERASCLIISVGTWASQYWLCNEALPSFLYNPRCHQP